MSYLELHKLFHQFRQYEPCFLWVFWLCCFWLIRIRSLIFCILVSSAAIEVTVFFPSFVLSYILR